MSDIMTINNMKKLNRISCVGFLCSSVSLCAIGVFPNINAKSVIGYTLALIFWIGLAVGIVIQIILSGRIKKEKTLNPNKNKRKTIKILYISALAEFLMCVVFVVIEIKIMFLFTLCLSVVVFSVEAAAVINKEEIFK